MLEGNKTAAGNSHSQYLVLSYLLSLLSSLSTSNNSFQRKTRKCEMSYDKSLAFG